MTTPATLPSIPNLRDLGGHPTRGGGRVRTGLAYRSVDLSRATDEQVAALASLGIRTVCDLRTDVERAAAPDRLPDGVRLVVADVLADDTGASPAAFGRVIEDVSYARRTLGDGRAERFFLDAYREFVALPSACAAYSSLFTEMARTDGRPMLFHCASGKDRTGWAAAALLLLLGVPEDRVMADYVASNDALEPVFGPLLEMVRSRGGDPALLQPLVEARPAYLVAALDEVRTRHGSLAAWFADGLGIDDAGQERLRATFVEPA